MKRIPQTLSPDESNLVEAFLRSGGKIKRIKSYEPTYKEVLAAYRRGRTRTLRVQERNRREAALESASAFTGEKYQRPKKGTGI